MKRVLYVNGKASSAWRWGLQGEVIKRLQENSENEVFVLSCNNCVKSYCWVNNSIRPTTCRMCKNMTAYIAKESGIKDNNFLKLKKQRTPRFPNFKTIQDAILYSHDGYEYGLGPVATLMSSVRDYNFDMKWGNKYLKKHMATVHTVIKNMEKLHKKFNFDEIHVFNGRHSFQYGCVSFAKKHGIPFFIYDRGGNINRTEVFENVWLHDFYERKRRIKSDWENSELQNKHRIAEEWYKNRRNRHYQSWFSFTENQKIGSLPKIFDSTKENIVFFNSSIDEVFAFDSWKHPFANTENDIINAILERYKDDSSKHFYLRIHPNLTDAKKNNTSQIREINAIKNKYKNLTIIEPEDTIDSYALIDAADKIITAYSTIGCEATYWGKPSILAGKSVYEDYDCIYKANNYEELFDLIDTKDLSPKPRENCYPFAYHNETKGFESKYYIATAHDEGRFLGKKLEYVANNHKKPLKILKAEFLVWYNLISL